MSLSLFQSLVVLYIYIYIYTHIYIDDRVLLSNVPSHAESWQQTGASNKKHQSLCELR